MVATAQVALPLLRGTVEGARCDECPFSINGRAARPVCSEHPEHPAWILVGEGPGSTEVVLNRPFVGPSGQVVDKILAKIGRPRNEIFVGNATLCVDGATNVRLADGSLRRIDQLVSQRYGGLIQSIAPDGSVVARRVVGWFRNQRGPREMHDVSFRWAQRTGGSGRVHTVMTEDHPILTPEGWLAAAGVSGGLIATGDLAPTGVALDIAVGTLLGDGMLHRGSLIVRHAEDQREYLEAKGAALGGLGIGWFESAPGKNQVQRQYGFRTKAGSWGHAFEDKFYLARTKRIPIKLLEDAGLLAFAIWYLDDGSMKQRPPRSPDAEICGVGFVEDELRAAAAVLERKHGIHTTVRNGRIRFGVEATAKFSRAIARFVPPSMAYKLRPEDRGQFDPAVFATIPATPFFDVAQSTCVSPRRKRESSAVYCLEVEGTHNFITPAAVVHNCQPPRGSPDHMRELAAKACKPRLDRELAQWPGIPVLTLGAVAARALIPQATLDAVDPPTVPKSKKRSQKERQRAEARALAREVRLRVKAIDKIAKARLKAKIKVRREQLIEQYTQRSKSEPFRKRPPRPTIRQLDTMIKEQREMSQMKLAADREAVVEYANNAKERELAAQFEAAHPKRKKPPKPKKIKITDIMGTCFDVDVDGSGVRPLIPAIHPAALLRGGGATIGGTHTPDLAFVNLVYDAGKVNALARGDDVRLTVNIETEISDEERTWQLLRDIVYEGIAEGEIALDLETYVDDVERHHALMAYVAKIKAIGLATTQRAVSLLWGKIPPWAQVFVALVLAHPRVTKTFHNGIYDRTVLAANGFVIDGPWEDTLLAHHAAFPGCAHRLQVVASQFFATAPWKCLRRDVEVLLPDRSTTNIRDFVRKRLPEVLSLENGQIVSKRVIGWHEVHVPGQEWVSIRTTRCDKKYTRGLVVTPDHRVMTQRGLVEAAQLVPGDDHIAIDEPEFSEDQISVVVGTLLGDSSLFVSRAFHKCPWDATRASVRGGHTNLGLRDCKVAALPLGTVCATEPAALRQSNDTTINAAEFFHYGTKWAFQYMKLAKLVYDENWRRRIKPEALAVLGRRGLAMLYMDDGTLRQDGAYVGVGFATNGFLDEDVELFAQWIRERYGAASIYRSAGPYCQLSAAASRNMLEDLRGYIHPSCRYKTIYDDVYREVQPGDDVHRIPVVSVDSVIRDEKRPALFDYRYCLSVEDTKLFYTNYGLVSNSEFRNAEETPDSLTIYNAKDTGATHALRPQLQFWVERTKTEKIYALDKKMAEIASKMHLAGMPVSRGENTELLQTFSKNVAEARRAVESIADDPKLHEKLLHYLALQQAQKRRKNDSEVLNDRYQQRLSEIRYDTKWKWKIGAGKHIAALLQALGVALHQVTATGQISTKKDVLEALANVPVVRDILSFRENDKLFSTFCWLMFDRFDSSGSLIQHGYADENDRVHPIWVIHKITGRWASSEPVVSNVPKEKFKKLDDGTKKSIRPNLRKQVVAPEGRVFCGFDFAQLEARIIALISGDPFLCQVFAEGRDIHTECARVVFSMFDTLPKYEQKQARDVTKNFEYGAFYGGSTDTLWKTVLKAGHNVKLVDVAKAVALLMHRMPGVVAWQRNSVAEASRPPFEIRDFLLGRRRTFPMGQVEATEAMNFGVQAAGASIMNTAMARMDVVLAEYKEAFAIAQIHDAAVFECWEDDAPKLAEDVTRYCTQQYERDGRSIPFPVEVRVGKTWADV